MDCLPVKKHQHTISILPDYEVSLRILRVSVARCEEFFGAFPGLFLSIPHWLVPLLLKIIAFFLSKAPIKTAKAFANAAPKYHPTTGALKQRSE